MRHSTLAALMITTLFSGAALAASGEVIKNGSGSFAFKGTITDGTCEVVLPNTSLDFDVTIADGKLSGGQKIKTISAPVSFRNCDTGQVLTMKLTSTTGQFSAGYMKFQNSDGTDNRIYQIQVVTNNQDNVDIYNPTGDIYPGTYGIHIDGTPFYVHIKNNRNASFMFGFNIASRGSSYTAEPGILNGGLTYQFAYL